MNELAALFPADPWDELSVHQPVNYVRGRQRRAESAHRSHLSSRTTQKSPPMGEAFRDAHKGICRAQKTTFPPIIRALPFHRAVSPTDSISRCTPRSLQSEGTEQRDVRSINRYVTSS